MDFNLTDTQKEICAGVKDFFANQPHIDPETFNHNQFVQIGELGLFGINSPEKYGGMGQAYCDAASAFEALGYACNNNGLIFTITNQVWVNINVLQKFASEKIQAKYLPAMIAGEMIGCIAITEGEAGSDSMNMSTFATESADGKSFTLNGSKEFISNGPIADSFIVFAKTEPKLMKGVTAFLVLKTDEGVQVGDDIEKMGLNGCPTSSVSFNDCKVGKDRIIGRKNFGTIVLTTAMDLERCFEFAPNIGTMQRLAEQALDYAKQRNQFGKPIGDNQLIASKISRMYSAIEFSRLMLYKIAWQHDKGKDTFVNSSMFKLYVSEHYIQTCRDVMQIFGGYGFVKEYGIERELRDAMASSIYSGTNEMQLNTIYKMIE